MKHRNWLILSHAFNMDGRAASQTITDKVPYLLEAGANLQVLSAVTGDLDQKIPHRQLLPWGAAGLRFDFRFWLRRKIGRGAAYNILITLAWVALSPMIVLERFLIGLPSQWSWAIPATLVGVWRVKRCKVDLIYSTGGAWSAHLAGYWIWRLTGAPWIVELHDPMVQVYQEQDKDRETLLLLWLERKICAHATLVWWFTEAAEASARRRNPQLGERGFNGLAGADPPIPDEKYQPSEKIRFAHFGSLTNTRSLVPFIDALAKLSEEKKIDLSKVELHVYGGSLDESSKETIRKYSFEGIIQEHGRIEADENESGRSKIMREMIKADVLLLMHGEDEACREYIPSKFYEYLWARSAMMAFHHKNPQFAGLVVESQCYSVRGSDDAVNVLTQVVEDWGHASLGITTGPISTHPLVQAISERINCA
jgi:glycosyltransferase involved in cell wall biosynthesis